jgi:hypothetical protein
MKKSVSIALLFFVFASGALSQQKFDILWFSTPAGWERQNTSSQLTLFKKSMGSAPAQILLYPSIATGKNADADFNAQWRKYVKGMYRGVADSFSVDVQNDGDCTYYSSYSYAIINKTEVVIALTCLRSKYSMMSVVNIIPNESYMADINSFFGGLEIEEGIAPDTSNKKGIRRKKVSIKKRAPKFRPGKGLRDAIN